MGCCVSQEGTNVRGGNGAPRRANSFGGGQLGGVLQAERSTLGCEARDVNHKMCPPPHSDWLEKMLMDVGTDLTSVARDFPRMIIAIGKEGSDDETNKNNHNHTNQNHSSGGGSSSFVTTTMNNGSLDSRIDAVRRALRAMIELSESGVIDGSTDAFAGALATGEGVGEGAGAAAVVGGGDHYNHYYALKAAAIDSPVNVASTNVDSEAQVIIDDEDDINRQHTSTLGGVDATYAKCDTPCNANPACGTSNQQQQGSRPQPPPPLLTTANVARIPKGHKTLEPIQSPIMMDGVERQRRRVKKLLDRFDEEWKTCVAEWKKKNGIASATTANNNKSSSTESGGVSPAATDLSAILMDVFTSLSLCKKVILTRQQHHKLLQSKYRLVTEQTESAPSGEGRAALAGDAREEATRYRLGLVGDLELNEAQKLRKIESTQNFKNIMKANAIDDAAMSDGDDGDYTADAGQTPGNDSFFPMTSPYGADGGPPPGPPNRNTTNIPRRNRSSVAAAGGGNSHLVRRNHSGMVSPHSTAAAKANSNVKSSIEACMTIVEESDQESVAAATPRQPQPPRGQQNEPTSQDHHRKRRSNAGEEGGGNSSTNGSSDGDHHHPHPPAARKTPSGLVRRGGQPTTTASNTAASSTTTKKSKKDAAAASLSATTALNNTEKRETWIANSRAMDVLFYFSQGVMFFPSQRIRFAFWFPWVSTLRDVSWESRIYTDPEMTLAQYLQRSRPSSPLGRGVASFDAVPFFESPFFAGAHECDANIGSDDVGNHKGLIFISHRMRNRNYVGTNAKERETVPEFQVDWSVEIVLDKNGAITHHHHHHHHSHHHRHHHHHSSSNGDDHAPSSGAANNDGSIRDVANANDSSSSASSPVTRTDSKRFVGGREMKFVDAKIVVKAVYIKRPPTPMLSFGSPSELWTARKRLLVDHVYNAFKVQPVLVDEFPDGSELQSTSHGGKGGAAAPAVNKAGGGGSKPAAGSAGASKAGAAGPTAAVKKTAAASASPAAPKMAKSPPAPAVAAAPATTSATSAAAVKRK